MRAAASTLTARLFENICENFALRSGVPSVPRISASTITSAAATSAASSSSDGAEADERQQQAAEEEADALQRVLRAGQDRDPAEERVVRAVGHDELDGALGAHLRQVLRDARERLRAITYGTTSHAAGASAEHQQRDDLDGEAHRRASP